MQAARVSSGARNKHVSNDEGLIRYLMRHWHSTPFEMCELKLHVKLPVFVARQWIRHRTATSTNTPPLLDPGSGVLHPRPRTAGRPKHRQQQGRGAVLEGGRGRPRARDAEIRRHALLLTIMRPCFSPTQPTARLSRAWPESLRA